MIPTFIRTRLHVLISCLALILIWLTLFTGCGQAGNHTEEPDPPPMEQPGNEAPPDGSSDGGDQLGPLETIYPLTVTDSTGTEITLDRRPERVVSIDPGETEVLYFIGADEFLVGTDRYSNYPEEAAALPKVGDLDSDLETLLELQPDLIVANEGLQSDVIEQLRNRGLPVYASHPKTVNDVIQHIARISIIMDRQETAKNLTEQLFMDKVAIIVKVKDAPKKKVYMELAPGWTVGEGELLSELIMLAGGINIAADQQGWLSVDPGQFTEANPDVIIYSQAPSMDGMLEEIKNRPGWETMEAVQNERLYSVDDDLVRRAGPRVVEALREIAKAIHPDLVE